MMACAAKRAWRARSSEQDLSQADTEGNGDSDIYILVVAAVMVVTECQRQKGQNLESVSLQRAAVAV